ncbi:MAG: cation diffusion facilitator family transporter [Candidatus Omnitrophota bacterium]|jgi:cation diffusion facilitator family transporter
MENYHSLSLRVSWFSIFVNAILAIAQFIVGMASGSISIIVDAVDSLRDIVATGVVVFSLNLSRKPADKEHPFGHGRIEDVGGIIISLLLVLIGLTFLKDSFLRLIHPKTVTINFFIVGIMAVVAIVKLFLGYITQVVSKKASSQILEADAFHHYTDCITTFLVAFGLIFVKLGFTYVDSILGLIIALLIIYWSYNMLRTFTDNLIGKRAPLEFYDKIKNIASAFKFVEGVHDIEIHSYGDNRVISLHIELSPTLSLEEAHSVADSIEKKIHSQKLGKCVVHMDLKHRAQAAEKRILEKAIRDFLRKNRCVKDFHGTEIITVEDTSIVNFHLQFEKKTPLEETHLISHKLSDVLKEKFGFAKVNIHIEPYKK